MTTVLRVNMNEIDDDLLRDWKARYGSSTVELRILDENENSDTLTESDFWAIIDSFDWTKEEEEDIMQPALFQLSALPITKIQQFQDILSYKLWQLDGQVYAAHLIAQDGFLSVDDFLYVRCAVVADGRSTFEEILQNPGKMPIEYSFESLLYLAADAYEQKTGEPMTYLPKYNFETFQNRSAWKKT